MARSVVDPDSWIRRCVGCRIEFGTVGCVDAAASNWTSNVSGVTNRSARNEARVLCGALTLLVGVDRLHTVARHFMQRKRYPL